MRIQRKASECVPGDRLVYVAPVARITDEPVEEIVALTVVSTLKGRTRLEFGRRSVTRYPNDQVWLEV